jgi:hypothetical protein
MPANYDDAGLEGKADRISTEHLPDDVIPLFGALWRVSADQAGLDQGKRLLAPNLLEQRVVVVEKCP